jgi:hypothetical protein
MDWKKKTVLLYAIGGLVLGTIAGFSAVKNAEKNDEIPTLNAKTGARVLSASLEMLKKLS